MSAQRFALTLWPEWAYAICALGKRVENRTWSRASVQGQWIAIHGGASIGGRKGQDAEADGIAELATMAVRARVISPPVGEAELRILREGARAAAGKIVAVAQVQEFVRASADPWFVGPVGWVLRGVAVLPQPVPVKGAQGLWPLGEEVAAQVRLQLQARPGRPRARDDLRFATPRDREELSQFAGYLRERGRVWVAPPAQELAWPDRVARVQTAADAEALLRDLQRRATGNTVEAVEGRLADRLAAVIIPQLSSEEDLAAVEAMVRVFLHVPPGRVVLRALAARRAELEQERPRLYLGGEERLEHDD